MAQLSRLLALPFDTSLEVVLKLVSRISMKAFRVSSVRLASWHMYKSKSSLVT